MSLTLVTQQQSQKYIFNFRQQTREKQSLNLDFWPLNSNEHIIIIGMSITSHIFKQFFAKFIDFGVKFEDKFILTKRNNFGGKWQILTNSCERSADVTENNYISLLQTNISLLLNFLINSFYGHETEHQPFKPSSLTAETFLPEIILDHLCTNTVSLWQDHY